MKFPRLPKLTLSTEDHKMMNKVGNFFSVLANFIKTADRLRMASLFLMLTSLVYQSGIGWCVARDFFFPDSTAMCVSFVAFMLAMLILMEVMVIEKVITFHRFNIWSAVMLTVAAACMSMFLLMETARINVWQNGAALTANLAAEYNDAYRKDKNLVMLKMREKSVKVAGTVGAFEFGDQYFEKGLTFDQALRMADLKGSSADKKKTFEADMEVLRKADNLFQTKPGASFDYASYNKFVVDGNEVLEKIIILKEHFGIKGGSELKARHVDSFFMLAIKSVLHLNIVSCFILLWGFVMTFGPILLLMCGNAVQYQHEKFKQ